MVNSKRVADEVSADTLWERLKNLNRETSAILAEARASGNQVIALQAIARAERQLELEARLLGERSGSTRMAMGVTVEKPQKYPYDLSLLTDQELAQLEVILARAEELTRAAARAKLASAC